MENNIKRTGTERLYRGWHISYGTLLILCFGFGITVNNGLMYLFMYGLIPQGLFQLTLGIVAMISPSEFNLSKTWLLYIWAFLSVFVLISLYLIMHMDYQPNYRFDDYLLVIIPVLPIIQYYALTNKSFKYE